MYNNKDRNFSRFTFEYKTQPHVGTVENSRTKTLVCVIHYLRFPNLDSFAMNNAPAHCKPVRAAAPAVVVIVIGFREHDTGMYEAKTRLSAVLCRSALGPRETLDKTYRPYAQRHHSRGVRFAHAIQNLQSDALWNKRVLIICSRFCNVRMAFSNLKAIVSRGSPKSVTLHNNPQ